MPKSFKSDGHAVNKYRGEKQHNIKLNAARIQNTEKVNGNFYAFFKGTPLKMFVPTLQAKNEQIKKWEASISDLLRSEKYDKQGGLKTLSDDAETFLQTFENALYDTSFRELDSNARDIDKAHFERVREDVNNSMALLPLTAQCDWVQRAFDKVHWDFNTTDEVVTMDEIVEHWFKCIAILLKTKPSAYKNDDKFGWAFWHCYNDQVTMDVGEEWQPLLQRMQGANVVVTKQQRA